MVQLNMDVIQNGKLKKSRSTIDLMSLINWFQKNRFFTLDEILQVTLQVFCLELVVFSLINLNLLLLNYGPYLIAFVCIIISFFGRIKQIPVLHSCVGIIEPFLI